MKNLSLKFWKWHSINLLPHCTVYSICDNDDHSKIIGRAIQITILGLVIDFMIPSSKAKKARMSSALGPMWSRKRKTWYTKMDEEIGL